MTTLRPFLEVVGTLVSIPEKTAVLSTQVAGQVQQLLVVEGQLVQAGDVLLRLDDRSAEAQRAKARAAVDESRAILSRLRHGSRSEDIDVARQELRKSETNLRLMRGRVQSGMALQDVHAIPELELAQRTADAEDAEADVAANQAKLKLLEAGPRPEEISEAEAKLAGAEADLAASELNLQLTRITAPFDGVLMDVPVRQGMFVSAGMTLMTLADLSTLFARTRIPTAYLSQVKEGQNVDIRVASFPDDAFTGAIARVRKQADVQTGDVDAFASAPNPDGSLRPGLACRLQIWLPEIRDAVAVPVAAIADRDGTSVVTVVRDGKAHETEVRLGTRTGELVQIISGLSPGDLVTVEGGYGLPDGCPCTVVLDSQVTASSATE
ncbi:MAG: efflux RND transporter periplasmic adaptor subunit [Phycisphaerales bacterium]|nr:efflux RND transporter periplasmic adaptor subunit [Phycisphaerales bacterium]